MTLVKRGEKQQPISAEEYDAVVVQVEQTKIIADTLQSEIKNSKVVYSLVSEAEMISKYNELVAASNAPENGYEGVFRSDLNQFWKWNSALTAKAEFSRDNINLSNSPEENGTDSLSTHGAFLLDEKKAEKTEVDTQIAIQTRSNYFPDPNWETSDYLFSVSELSGFIGGGSVLADITKNNDGTVSFVKAAQYRFNISQLPVFPTDNRKTGVKFLFKSTIAGNYRIQLRNNYTGQVFDDTTYVLAANTDVFVNLWGDFTQTTTTGFDINFVDFPSGFVGTFGKMMIDLGVAQNDNYNYLAEEFLKKDVFDEKTEKFAPLESPTFTGTVNGITKSMVDLPNADNTSDADKPTSTDTLNLITPLQEKTSNIFQNFSDYVWAKTDSQNRILLAITKAGELYAPGGITENTPFTISSADLTAIKAIFPLFGKKLVSLGDSLTEQIQWQPYLVELTGMVWSELETTTGTGGFAPMGVGGSKIVPEVLGGTGTGSGQSIYIRANDVVNYNPDVIILNGSQNDLTVVQPDPTTVTPYTGGEFTGSFPVDCTFSSCYLDVLQRLVTQNPTALIITGNRTYNGQGNTRAGMNRLNDAIRYFSESYAIPHADLMYKSGINPINYANFHKPSDTVHWNLEGGKRIAGVFNQALNKFQN